MVEVYDKSATGKYSELFVLYRHGHPVHIHNDRKVFEDWMVTSRWLYPPAECEIVRFVPEATAFAPAERMAPCQCCSQVRPLRCGPSRLGEQTWACDECWVAEPAEGKSP